MAQDYEAVLRVAVAAVQEAAELLRADLLRPAGPDCYSPDHAYADEAAERLIRERVLAVSPDGWGYRGEETQPRVPARPDVAGQRHLWLVDPNDGTASYCEGWRGSATSIALLRDGAPVLGVVYAFAAPDDGGDLFAWAEGCGPLRRNGQPVTRPDWQTVVTPETVTIVSQGADRRARGNVAEVAPGRYLSIASIAYRLALVAAGDGEVAVGLAHAGDWDYAGGHALLRSAGGELIDQAGAPVTYHATSGASTTRFCFGGSPALIQEIRRRPWQDVLSRPKVVEEEPFGLAWPARGQIMGNNPRLRRVQGCWLGQLTGDALGSMVEFQSGEQLRRRFPDGLHHMGPSPVWQTLAGQPTDDSELALVLARTLLHTGHYDAEQAAAAYCWWRQSGPFDVGGTIRRATDAMRGGSVHQSRVALAAQHANGTSQANGALMRQSPLAIWGHALPPAALDHYVRADTCLTHPHQVCQDASAAFAVALAAIIGEGLDGPAAHARALAWSRQEGSSSEVTAALASAATTPSGFADHPGWVLIALQNAFYQALHAASFEDGVVATVMGGGDTDTNGAVAGALLGALHGAAAIPAAWRQAVLTCRSQQGGPGVQRPRPRALWPVDALILAERLAVTGWQWAQRETTG